MTTEEMHIKTFKSQEIEAYLATFKIMPKEEDTPTDVTADLWTLRVNLQDWYFGRHLKAYRANLSRDKCQLKLE